MTATESSPLTHRLKDAARLRCQVAVLRLVGADVRASTQDLIRERRAGEQLSFTPEELRGLLAGAAERSRKDTLSVGEFELLAVEMASIARGYAGVSGIPPASYAESEGYVLQLPDVVQLLGQVGTSPRAFAESAGSVMADIRGGTLDGAKVFDLSRARILPSSTGNYSFGQYTPSL